MNNEAHVHHTTKGRIVYHRRRHLMGLKDAIRIIRFVVINSREDQRNRQLQELADDYKGMQIELFKAVASKLGYVPEDKLPEFAADILWLMLSNNNLDKIIPETSKPIM